VKTSLYVTQTKATNKISQKQHSVDFIANKIILSPRRRCMFQPVTGPSSGETNTMSTKEGNVRMKVTSLLHT